MEAEPGPQQAETPSVLEGVFRNRDLFLFMPFVLGFSERQTHQIPNPESPESNGGGDPPSPERVILVNPFTQGMVVLEGSRGLDPLLRTLLGNRKDGRPPASKASVDAMPTVEMESGGGECVICLDELTAGETAKEMPCKHRFHGECIEKWLGLHGSCPVCRYEMPVDEEDLSKKRDDGNGRRREIWVRFSFNDGGRRSRDSDRDGGGDSGDHSDSGDRTVLGSDN
ncbi:PREDICTED: E3 ubiquitin-protein ligase RING1-like [Tarenaya hassleriana]|uniref:E3 ubiquitin-protein ligase RING1-like n=1 Tax=Tarenaya hassleriana TaxID=28532 RepID=UPI00053C9369|nr:PREDICTED: E3 ubiquitin-protein ligase RING1-like [Tarenaya hassleriana]